MFILKILQLYAVHFKNSKRIIFISTIGLILTLTIFSATTLYVESSKEDIVDEYLKRYAGRGYDSEYDIVIEGGTNYYDLNFPLLSQQLKKVGDALINESRLTFFKEFEFLYNVNGFLMPLEFGLSGEDDSVSKLFNSSVLVFELNDALKYDLSSFVNVSNILPQNSNYNSKIPEAFFLETIFFDGQILNDETISFPTINRSQQIHPLYFGNPNYYGNLSLNVNITGNAKIISYPVEYTEYGHRYRGRNYLEDDYPSLSKIWRYFNQYNLPTLFVTNITSFMELIDLPIDKGIPEWALNVFYTEFRGGYNIDLEEIDVFSIGSNVEDISLFANSFESRFLIESIDFFGGNYNGFLRIQFRSYITYVGIGNYVTSVLFGLLVFAFPIILIAIFVMNYSFGLIYKNVVRQIGIFKIRGSSNLIILIFEIIDVIVIFLISISIALISGIPLAFLALKTDFLLSFNNQASFDVISTFFEVIFSILESLFYFAILINIFISLRRIVKLSKMEIKDTENPEEKGDPYWKKHYIDVILFFYGVISYFLLYYMTSSPLGGQINSVILIFMYLSIPSPFAMVIGAVLLLNRVIPVILNMIGSVLWQKTGGIVAFSFKNVIRHRQASTRAIMLISVMLCFSVLFYSAPVSQIQYTEKSALYELGAESALYLSGFDPANITLIQKIMMKVSNLLETNFSDSIEYTEFIKLGNYNRENSIQFTFINTSSYFSASAISSSKFSLGLNYDIQVNLQKLGENPKNLILHQNELSNQRLKLEDTYTVFGIKNNTQFKIIDSFQQWPTTLRYTWDTRNVYGIANIDYILKSNQTKIGDLDFNDVNNNGYLINFKEGVNKSYITKLIEENITDANIEFDFVLLEQFTGSLENVITFKMQLGQININVVMSAVISVAILIMFAYMQLNDRRREIFTERALGMKLYQTSVLFFIESLILITTGIIIGTILGLFLMEMMTLFFTSGTQIPTYDILITWDLIIITYLILILLSVLSALIPAYYVSKKEISQAFGGEI